MKHPSEPTAKLATSVAALSGHHLVHHLPIWLVAALLLVAVWSHVFSLIAEDRTRTLDAAEGDIINLARVSQEHAERTLASADQTLRLVVARYRVDGDRIDLKTMVEEGLIDTRVVLQVSVVGADGVLRHSNLPISSRVDLSDREHFKVHLTPGKAGLFVSRPILGRSSGKWSIQLSRRIAGKNGAFGGVVVASLDPVYFSGFYSELKLGKQGVSTLFGLDGAVRARRVGQSERFSGDLSATPMVARLAKGEQAGTYTSRSVLDSVERMLHFRKLPSYPLGIAIGLDTKEVLADHRKVSANLENQAAIASGFLLLIALLASWYVVARQRHSKAQEKSLTLLQELTSRVPGLIYQYRLRPDGSSCFPFASEAMRKIYRLDPEEVREDASKVDAVLHPDDFRLVRASIEQSAQELTPWSQEYRVRFEEGTERWLFGNALPQREADGSIVWHGFITDITERKQAEAQLRHTENKFRMLFELSPVGMALVDHASGEFLEVNRAVLQSIGYTRDEFLSLSYWDITPREYESQELQQIRDLNETGKFGPNEKEYIRKDGSRYPIKISGAICAEASEKSAVWGVIEDISVYKQFEAELLRSNSELEQFSYAISHDMRQPLRMISSYLKLLDTSLANQLNPEQRRYFNFAIDGAKRLDQMLVDLLDYSRVGRQGEPVAWAESRAVVEEVLRFLQPAIDEAQADVRIEGDWPRVLVRADEILRLLQNLIGNALKFRVAGRTPEIVVSSEIVDKAWRVSIVDNGIGILPGQAGRLFQVFQRLQLRAAYEGTGIGLALCRRIAEHHGGSIVVTSLGEGQGCTFTLSLPMPAGEAS